MPSFYFKDIPFDSSTARNVPLDPEEEIAPMMFFKCLPIEMVGMVRVAGMTVMLFGFKTNQDRVLMAKEQRPTSTQGFFNDDMPLVSDKELTLHKNAGRVMMVMPFHAP